MFKKNTAITGFTFTLIAKTDGSAITTGTVNAFVTLDGGTQTSITATPAHEGNGQWSINLTAGEMNGDVVGLLFTHADALPASFTIKTDTKLVSELNDFDSSSDGVIVTTNNDKTGYALSAGGVTAVQDGLSTFNPASDTVANVTTVNEVENVGLGAISGNSFEAGAINAGIIANDTITAAKIQNGAFTTVKFAEPNDFKADVSGLSTFDASSDGVIVTTNNDKTGYALSAGAVTAVQSGLATSSALATVDSNVDDILTDTGTTIPAQISNLNNIDAEDVWTHATRTLSAFSFSVTVGTNNDKTGYALSTAGVNAVQNGLSTFDHTADNVTLANGAHGGASASITLADYSDFQGSGGATAEAIYTYFTDGVRADEFKADVSGLSTFDALTDAVTLANGAHGGASASITLSDYSDFQGSGGATAEAIYNYFTDGTRADNFKADVSGLSTLTASGVWSHAFRTITDKEGFSLSASNILDVQDGLATTANINALNDIDAEDVWTYATRGLTETVDANIESVTSTAVTNVNDFRANVSGLATEASLAAVEGKVDSVLEDTSNTIPAQISGLNNISASDVSNAVLSAVVETGLTLQDAMQIMNALIAGETTVSGSIVTFKDSQGNNFATMEYGGDGERNTFTLL